MKARNGSHNAGHIPHAKRHVARIDKN